MHPYEVAGRESRLARAQATLLGDSRLQHTILRLGNKITRSHLNQFPLAE